MKRLLLESTCSRLFILSTKHFLLLTDMNIRGYLFDLDGVIWFGERLAPGARDFIEHCEQAGIPYAFVTNASALSRANLLSKFHRLGLTQVVSAQIFSASRVLGEYIAARKPNARVLVLGEQGTIDELTLAGVQVVSENADFVAIGADRSITYDKLTRICREVLNGAEIVASNQDRHFPHEDGLLPGAGAFKAFVEYCSNKIATVVGKPAPAIFEQAIRWLGFAADELMMIGDTPEVDILGARAVGLRTTLLGAHLPADLPENMRPDVYARDLAQLLVR